MFETLALCALRRFDPETAHGLALKALNTGLAPRPGPITSTRLHTHVAGLDLPNPVGLAAGFDKNATAIAPLSHAGFGFIEVGAATPRPQSGNPKPRLFRLTEDRAAINRFGFNNDGMDAIATRLAARPAGIPVGLNLGANKDSTDRAADFARVLTRCGPHVDFATVNVSSPNTEKLRDLQGKAALTALLQGVIIARGTLDQTPTNTAGYTENPGAEVPPKYPNSTTGAPTLRSRPLPIFLKIAPDLTDAELADVAEVALATGIDAIIATNTTLDRHGLKSRHRDQAGGLSGAPLFDKSTRTLARLSQLTQGNLPLIGVGGVDSAESAYAKIRAGASCVQLYTAMVYKGLSLAAEIARGLDHLLEKDGFDTVAQAVGTGRKDYLK